MKTIKKTAAILLTAILVTGTAVTAFAAEDIPPAGELGTRSAETVQSPEVKEPPTYSVQDYQDMNDELADPTGRKDTSPALGTRYGNELIVNTPDDVMDEDSFPVEAANAIPDTAIPMADTPDEAEANEGDATPEEIANDTTTPEQTNANPATGAADVLPLLLTAIASLGAAPMILRKKK